MGQQVLKAILLGWLFLAASWTWYKGVRFARYWRLIYTPYLLAIALTLANSIGMIALPWLAPQTNT